MLYYRIILDQNKFKHRGEEGGGGGGRGGWSDVLVTFDKINCVLTLFTFS